MAVGVRIAIELHASDIDPAAVECARGNVGQVYLGDLFEALPDELRGRVDVLLVNVPYVATGDIPYLPAEAREHEPRTALDGGTDGLDVFRTAIGEAGDWLTPGGALFSEVTDAQADAALAAVRRAGLTGRLHRDDDLEATVVEAFRPR